MIETLAAIAKFSIVAIAAAALFTFLIAFIIAAYKTLRKMTKG